MVKKDIVDKIKEKHGGISRREAKEYVDTLLALMVESIAEKGDLLISGFGKFAVRENRARSIIMPNGTPMETDGGLRVRFTPSSKLNVLLNGDER